MSEKHRDHHHHHDHRQPHESHEPNRIFKIGIGLNLSFALIEIYFGFAVQSLALISDAIHNLTDVFGLILSWLGFYLTTRSKSKKYSLYAAFFNSTALIAGSIFVIREGILRLQEPASPVAKTIIFVSAAGFFINFISAKMFHEDHHHDLNMRSAYLHLMADAGISLSVAVSGILMYFFNLTWLDSVLSILISFYIVISTWKIMAESFRQIRGKLF